MLEMYIKELFTTSSNHVEVAWQGGEPMLRGIDFYQKSVELANKYQKTDQTVLHTIQTNGTLITDEWAIFFKKNNYLVGLSIDGTKELHDVYRVDKKRGWKL